MTIDFGSGRADLNLLSLYDKTTEQSFLTESYLMTEVKLRCGNTHNATGREMAYLGLRRAVGLEEEQESDIYDRRLSVLILMAPVMDLPEDGILTIQDCSDPCREIDSIAQRG
ncbi:hypothetical protein Tco_1361900 [Tanacetum coccineum]